MRRAEQHHRLRELSAHPRDVPRVVPWFGFFFEGWVFLFIDIDQSNRGKGRKNSRASAYQYRDRSRAKASSALVPMRRGKSAVDQFHLLSPSGSSEFGKRLGSRNIGSEKDDSAPPLEGGGDQFKYTRPSVRTRALDQESSSSPGFHRSPHVIHPCCFIS